MITRFRKKVKTFLNIYLTSSVFTAGELIQMTVPFILDSLSIMLINMLITALISSAGETSVAAVNLVGPITTLIVCSLNGIAAGGTVAVTQSYGSGNIQRTKEAAGHILWLIVLVGTACSLLLLLFPRPILSTLYRAAEPVVLDKAVKYAQGSAISLIIFTIYTGVFCILRGLGESKKCLVLTIIINVAYLLFSVLFINILDMDITGSNLAQIVARAIGSASALAFLFLAKSLPIHINFKSIFSFRKDILHSIMQVSIPFGMEQIFLYGGNIVVTSFMVKLGTAAVATHAIANSIFCVVTSAAIAAGNLGVTVVGRCIGAGDQKWAYSYGKKMNILALLLILAASALFYPTYPLMLKYLYHTNEAATALVLHLLYRIFIPMCLFWPISNTMPYILRSANDTVFPSVLSFLSMWGIRVGLGYLLAIRIGLGLDGIWLSMWIEWAVRSVVLLVRFIRKRWLSKAVPQPA